MGQDLRYPASLIDCGKPEAECGVERPHAAAADAKRRKRLWQLSEKLVKDFAHPLESSGKGH